MAIEWNAERMATGLPEIDTQHQEWMRRFNEFDNAVVNLQGHNTILSTLDFLTQYTETHFASEEAIMTRLNSPALAANRAAHNEFRRKLAEIKAWVSREGVSMVEVIALKVTLEEWLVNHILTIDMQLRGAGTRG
jgi:hemerythrin